MARLDLPIWIQTSGIVQILIKGLHFVAVIRNYVGKSLVKYMGLIKRVCVSDEDYVNNAEKLLQMLNDSGIITHFQKRDLVNASSRESLLFLFQL